MDLWLHQVLAKARDMYTTCIVLWKPLDWAMQCVVRLLQHEANSDCSISRARDVCMGLGPA